MRFGVRVGMLMGIMDVPEQYARRLAELAAATPCIRDHACLTSGPQALCKARLSEDGSAVLCLEDEGWQCRYSIPFGQGLACTCLLRQYTARHLGQTGSTV